MSRVLFVPVVFFAFVVSLSPPASAGETQVYASVTTPADVAAGEVEAQLATVAPPPQRSGGSAEIQVRTADTLGPSYLVTKMQFSIGQDAVGSIDSFDTKPGKRRVLREGPTASVDSRGDRLRVQAVVRGVGSGDFDWLNRYEYTVNGLCPVELSAGDLTQVDVVVIRKAPLMADFGEGLQIECRSAYAIDG